MSKSIDNKLHRDLVQRLEQFGFNEKQARVYIALLPHRDIGSSKLVYATGLHGQFVYDALARLESMGLAKHVIQNGRKKFSANTPMRILSLLEEKKLSAQATVRELQDRFVGEHEQDFEVFQGESAFVAHEFESLETTPEGSQINVIGGPNMQYMSIIGNESEEFERIRLKKHITIRYIGAESQRQELISREKEETGWTYRILSGHSVGIVNTDIWHDQIHLNIFGTPLISFVLTSKEVADGYREFFNAIWNLSNR